MNIFIKLPLVLVENISLGLFPSLRSKLEKIYNPYFFGDSYVKYTQDQYKSLKKTLGQFKNKTLLELGPGGSVGLGLLSLNDGLKKYIAIDSENHLDNAKAISMYGKLLNKNVAEVKVLLKKVEVKPLNKNFGYDLVNNSVDLIYSCAVMEHVKNLDICFAEMARVLKKGGMMNHQVDLRDHVFSQQSLFFLTIPQKLFDLLFWNSGVWVNRARWSQYVKIFDKYGLKIVKVSFNIKWKKTIPNYLKNKYSVDDIKKLSFNVVLQKI